MEDFVYQALAARVVFGPGKRAEIPAETERLGMSAALVISTGSQRAVADDAVSGLGNRCAGRIDGVTMHVPRADVDAALAETRRTGADGLVAVGGGSAVGLAKAIALETDLPILAVPSTYAGSEMTDIWGISEGGRKTTGRTPVVVPKAVIYDPDLTAGMPARIAGPSGINAIAHSVEALYAQNRNPVLSMIAEEGIRALAAGLPGVCSGTANGGSADDGARGDALYGAFLCGLALGTAAMGIHHKLCHVLGGSFGLPHAETHTVILPHATHFNRDAAPGAMQAIARALGSETAAGGLFDLAVRVGAPTGLEALGFRADDLDRAADIATEAPYYNPRPVDRDGVRELLDDAFHGRRPT